MSWKFQKGARCAVSKQSTRADKESHVVVTFVDKDEAGNLATLAILPDEAAAIELAAAIRSGDAEALAAAKSKVTRELSDVAKGSLHSLTGEWRKLSQVEATDAHESEHDEPEGADLIGTVLEMHVPVDMGSSGLMMVEAEVTIDSAAGSKVVVSFGYNGETRHANFEAKFVRKIINKPKEWHPPPFEPTIDLGPDDLPAPMAKLLRALPISRRLAASLISGNEARDVAVGAGFEAGITLGRIEDEDKPIILQSLRSVCSALTAASTSPAWHSWRHAWPDNSASRLGRALSGFIKGAGKLPEAAATRQRTKWHRERRRERFRLNLSAISISRSGKKRLEHDT